MRHKVAGRKLGRTAAHRRAMLRNMATSLFKHERIFTTLPKAKELKRVADKLVTLGKTTGTPEQKLHARRQLLSYLMSKEIAHKVMDDVAPRFAERAGGYTRIYRLGARPGDMAEKAIIELVDYQLPAPSAKKKTDKKK
ncbi:MAG: 50S ribosomal protein L17 [Acidobacteria bacterium]|nr:50S ribosomal protein L17 [Acidobacteriota bacterium]